MSQAKAASNAPKALIIEPSKELAEQTLNVVKQFKKYVDNPKVRYGYLCTFVLNNSVSNGLCIINCSYY